MIGFEVFLKYFDADRHLTMLDGGAHVGNSVSELVELFPSSTIYAFEPDPKNFDTLTERFAGNRSVHLSRSAIAKADGRAVLHENNYDATHSLLPFDAEVINTWADASDFVETGQMDVPTVSIDSFCQREHIECFDLLKLDIQGGELAALQGAEGLLSRHNIACIFTEVEFRPLYKGQPLFWDVDGYLRQLGYHFVSLVQPKVTNVGVMAWADAVYVNNKLWGKLESMHSAGMVKE